MIEYVGKCLVIEEKEKVLVIGDLHLAHLGRLDLGGMNFSDNLYKAMIDEFDSVFKKVGKIDKIVLLGDLRSGFGRLEIGERNEIGRLIDYLSEKCEELIIVKGNHDNYVMSVLASRNLEVKNFWKWKNYLFIHGDKGVNENVLEEVESVITGHIHPAIVLEEGAKKEKYKCFLVGKVGRRNLIIMPSFLDVNEGIDVLSILEEKNELGADLRKFEVKIIGENLEVLDFGKLKDLI